MTPDTAVALQHALKYGTSSTSFLTVYPGFKYFIYEEGDQSVLIAYSLTSTAWVGASEPLGEENLHLKAILGFIQAAKKDGKTALLLPASEKLAHAARKAGLCAIEIGQEPWFKLKEFQKPNIVKQLESKGARAEKFNPAHIAPRERLELESVTQAWLDSRKSAPLAFLNQVRPWLQLQQKRYYRVIHNGHQCGYLAAIPVAKRNGWYLIDLIRSPVAPLGTTELLISQAVTELTQEGVEFMTLGMSPLARVSDQERKEHRLIYAAFGFTFEKMSLFYNFKPLFRFKEKMKPTSWEPLYLISAGGFVGPRGLIGLFQAVYTSGILKTFAMTGSRLMKRMFSYPELSHFLSNQLVFRSKPDTFLEYCARMKVTLALFATNVLFFVASTTENFTLRDTARQRMGFQILKILNGINTEDLRALFLHSFYHWNFTHLAFNMSCMLIFVGFLETIVGSSLTLSAYISGILFSNPLISIILVPLFEIFNHPWAEKLLREEDVGCSLGVFACIGALAFFLKKPKLFLSVFVLGTIATSISTSSVLAFNHLAALAIGYGASHYYLRRHEK